MMQATACRFKRAEKDNWEMGIAILINGENEAMIDKQGKLVDFPVWDFNLIWEEGTFSLMFAEDT